MSKPTIFLDIDGVLNDTPITVRCPRILPQCAEALAALVSASGAEIVLTTSWRKWILPEPAGMSLLTFSRLLGTHGITCTVAGRIANGPVCDRETLILQYVEQHGLERWVVLDDLDLKIDNFVRTDGDRGLTYEDVLTAYRILRDGRCEA